MAAGQLDEIHLHRHRSLAERLNILANQHKVNSKIKSLVSRTFNLYDLFTSHDLVGNSSISLEDLRQKMFDNKSNKRFLLGLRHQVATNEWLDILERIAQISNADDQTELVILAIVENCANLDELKLRIGTFKKIHNQSVEIQGIVHFF